MEALLLLLDVAVLIAAFAWAIRNGDADAAPSGLFRFKTRLSQPPGEIARRPRPR